MPNGNRTMKNEPGDWVAIRLPGGERAAKVIEATRDGNLIVRVRWSNGDEQDIPADGPLPRIRWTRRNGTLDLEPHLMTDHEQTSLVPDPPPLPQDPAPAPAKPDQLFSFPKTMPGQLSMGDGATDGSLER